MRWKTEPLEMMKSRASTAAEGFVYSRPKRLSGSRFLTKPTQEKTQLSRKQRNGVKINVSTSVAELNLCNPLQKLLIDFYLEAL